MRRPSRKVMVAAPIVGLILLLFLITHFYPDAVNWNSFVTDILTGAITTVFSIFATIWVYRYIFHKNDRNRR